MKILFLYMFPLWGNGSASFLRELSSVLVKRGHTIGIVAPDRRTLPGVTHYVVTSKEAVFVGHPELPKAKKLADMNGEELGEIYTDYLKATIKAVVDFEPEIIHVFHTGPLPGVARVIKVLFGIKFIITTHGSDLSYLVQDRRFIGLIDDANKVARFITANSEFTKKWYLDIFGYSLKRKSSVIMGGVNLSNYKRDPKEIEHIDKKYKLTGKKMVLYTGRLTKNKGVIYLVRAAPQIPGMVVIVGDGPERKTLEDEIKKRKLTNVILTGYISPINLTFFHAFYERADVYVAPSVWDEPLGLTILEAMAAKTPVIATRKGGVTAMVKDGTNGFLIKARNSKDIARAVNMLLKDTQLRKRVSEEAYKTVLEKFTWEKIATQFEDIYSKFRYSTSEYLARVRGRNPELSKFMRHMNRFLPKTK